MNPTYCLTCDELTTVTSCIPARTLLTGHKIVDNKTYNVSVCVVREVSNDVDLLRISARTADKA